MATRDEVVHELNRLLPTVNFYGLKPKTIRADIPQNSVALRNKITQDVIGFFPGSSTTASRPNDVKIPGGFTILVKPTKGAKKIASGAYYGNLEKIDLSAFKLNSFADISREFAAGNLANAIKEASDIKCVSELNEAIVKASKGSLDGITLKIDGFTFKNVIGCIPVTNGEPKADVVLVCKKDDELYPDCYISYKMGAAAKDFQQYSGLSEKSSAYIFNHKETLKFYTTLSEMAASGVKGDVYQLIEDKKIIGLSVWGGNYGGTFGVNNCHTVAQGSPTINGTKLTYTHSVKNGNFNFETGYQPVFGARYTRNRNNRGPNGMTAPNFRIGIYPRAYRGNKWL